MALLDSMIKPIGYADIAGILKEWEKPFSVLVFGPLRSQFMEWCVKIIPDINFISVGVKDGKIEMDSPDDAQPVVGIYVVDVRKPISADIPILMEITYAFTIRLVIAGVVDRPIPPTLVNRYRISMENTIDKITKSMQWKIFMIMGMSRGSSHCDLDGLIPTISSQMANYIAAIFEAKSIRQIRYACTIDWRAAVVALTLATNDSAQMKAFAKQLLMLRMSQIGQACLTQVVDLVKLKPLKNAVEAIMYMPISVRQELINHVEYEYEYLAIHANYMTPWQFLNLIARQNIHYNNREHIAWGRENFTDFMTAEALVDSADYPSHAIYLLSKSKYGDFVRYCYTVPETAWMEIITFFIEHFDLDKAVDVEKVQVMERRFHRWWSGITVVEEIPMWNLPQHFLQIISA